MLTSKLGAKMKKIGFLLQTTECAKINCNERRKMMSAIKSSTVSGREFSCAREIILSWRTGNEKKL